MLRTWNLRILMEAGKLKNLIIEMDRLNIGILGFVKLDGLFHGALKVIIIKFIIPEYLMASIVVGSNYY